MLGRGRGNVGRGGGGRGRGAKKSQRKLDFQTIDNPENPGTSRQQGAQSAEPAILLADQLKKAREMRLKDKKNVKKLTVAQKAHLDDLRDKKQVGRFLMPDAPEKKSKKTSPQRSPCPLLPGVPETPPKRIPRPWESEPTVLPRVSAATSAPEPSTHAEDSINSEASTSSATHADGSPGPVASTSVTIKRLATSTAMHECVLNLTPKKKKRRMVLSPTSGFREAMENETQTVVDDIDSDLDSVTPSSKATSIAKFVAGSPSSIVNTENVVEDIPSPSSRHIYEEVEDEIIQWEHRVQDLGSDLDDDPLDDIRLEMHEGLVDITLKDRTNFDSLDLNNIVSAEVCHEIETNDRQDDLALRQSLANKELLNFDWSCDANFFQGERETFLGTPGPTFDTEGLSPFQIFRKIWNESIMSLIVNETNKYGNDKKSTAALKKFSRILKWEDTSMDELWTFFAIIMLQSIVPLPVEDEYWYPCLPYLKVGNFQNLMSRNRFLLLKKCLHFVDNETLGDIQEAKKIAKVAPIVNHLNERFRSLYIPDQNISIDESLLLWKGRLSFAQLIEKKAAKVGIKSYELCDSKTGYLWAFKIYEGKKRECEKNEEGSSSDENLSNIPDGATAKIVYDLVDPLLNLGYTLVMDNFYNSPLLSRTLKLQKTDTMGTLRLNREFVPETLRSKNKSNMRTGEVVFTQAKDLTIVLWKDANVFSMISTYHKVEVGGKEKFGYYKYKPKVILDYNLAMGGVDKKDQMLQAFPVERIRNAVWYKKLFRRLLNVSIYNAYVIFSESQNISQRKFRVTLADEILKAFKKQSLQGNPLPKREGHFPIKNPQALNSRCKWCARKKVHARTVWQCDTCRISLCIIGCFREYHLAQE